jgi:hypothetical protein
MKFLRCGFSAAVALLVLAIPAAAAPVGTLATTACSGQGVTVSFTLIDWLPAGGGSGCIDTVSPTNVTYTGGGPLLPGSLGAVKDLPTGGGVVLDFMTFTGHPNLHFDLNSVGPGVANTACVYSFNPADPVCSVTSSSPFVLRPGPGGTTVTLAAFGVARDSSASVSNWGGTFSVDFAGESPGQVRDRFIATGSITSGHSGSFTVTFAPIPEPATAGLLGMGLVVAGILGRRRIRR